MTRIKIELPANFHFNTNIPVRITDLNYGGHVGNDTILSIIHEARVQYLASLGYSELNMEGASLIMADAAIEFKAELFYGDVITAYVTASEFSRVGFNLYYKLEKRSGDVIIDVAFAKTGMICFNYENRKVAKLPAAAQQRLTV